jgi:hypothetical protein
MSSRLFDFPNRLDKPDGLLIIRPTFITTGRSSRPAGLHDRQVFMTDRSSFTVAPTG